MSREVDKESIWGTRRKSVERGPETSSENWSLKSEKEGHTERKKKKKANAGLDEKTLGASGMGTEAMREGEISGEKEYQIGG